MPCPQCQHEIAPTAPGRSSFLHHATLVTLVHKKFAYDIWGDTVSIASRLESNGEADRINISQSTYEHIRHHFECEYRGKIPVKNAGEIDMYFVTRPKPAKG